MNKLKIISQRTKYANLRDLFKGAAAEYGDNDAFILKEKKGKDVSYKHISFSETWADIERLGSALIERGLENKRVAIIAKNCYPWVIAYGATLANGNVVVPIDKALPFEEAESSLARSYADILFFDSEHKDMVEEIKKNKKTNLTQFYCVDEVEGYTTFSSLLVEGKDLMDKGAKEFATKPINNEEMAIILFTSGTTSMSKAVMLSHKNLTTNVFEAISCEPLSSSDRNMAFLPYHHTFGSTGQLVMIAAGIATAYCDGIKYLQKNLVEYKISVFFCVPLLIESIYKKIMKEVESQGKTKLIKAVSAVSNGLLKVGIDIRRKAFKTILDKLGGNLRFLISGAAAVDPEVLEGFKSFGILTVQGYGITETSPIISAESSTAMRKGSVGKALPTVEVKIDKPNAEGIGEIMVYGDTVMLGYYENEEATKEVLQDGWYRTGDLGRIDKDGFVYICGRAKNVIVLKNGKNVYPEEIETLINNLPYIEESMVCGLTKKENDTLIIASKLVYNQDFFKADKADITDEEIKAIIDKDIDSINDKMPAYKHIKRVIVTTEPMIKTTTGKVKRYEELKELE